MEKKSIDIGEKIYLTGIGEGSQKIMAVVSGNEMPGTMMACVNCHGKCGKGTRLQGVDIPDIRRSKYIQRVKMDEGVKNVGRFLNSRLKKSITLGLNHKGSKMHNMMPRYKMSLSDMENLLAYLEVLGDKENCTEK